MENKEEQGDLFAARVARDEGIALVTEHNESWMERCLVQVEHIRRAHYKDCTTFTAEELRHALSANDDLEPKHPNAWGALTNTLQKRGIIERAGYGQMKDKRSHARETPLWRFVPVK